MYILGQLRSASVFAPPCRAAFFGRSLGVLSNRCFVHRWILQTRHVPGRYFHPRFTQASHLELESHFSFRMAPGHNRPQLELHTYLGSVKIPWRCLDKLHTSRLDATMYERLDSSPFRMLGSNDVALGIEFFAKVRPFTKCKHVSMVHSLFVERRLWHSLCMHINKCRF